MCARSYRYRISASSSPFASNNMLPYNPPQGCSGYELKMSISVLHRFKTKCTWVGNALAKLSFSHQKRSNHESVPTHLAPQACSDLMRNDYTSLVIDAMQMPCLPCYYVRVPFGWANKSGRKYQNWSMGNYHVRRGS